MSTVWFIIADAFVAGCVIGWLVRGRLDARSLADAVVRGDVTFNVQGEEPGHR